MPSYLEKTTYSKDRIIQAARAVCTNEELDELLYQSIIERSRYWDKRTSEKFIGVISDLIISEYPSSKRV